MDKKQQAKLKSALGTIIDLASDNQLDADDYDKSDPLYEQALIQSDDMEIVNQFYFDLYPKHPNKSNPMGTVIYKDSINYLKSIETELIEHFNELQNNYPDCYAEDHPMAQSIEALSQFIDKVNPTNPDIDRTIPHCPFCHIPMQSFKPNEYGKSSNEIVQHFECNECHCLTQIHQFI